MNKFQSIPTLIGLFAAQCFITFVLYVGCNFISMFLHYSVGGVVTFAAYAVIWWFIWWIQYGEIGISQFYAKLCAAHLPLVIFTLMYIAAHPVPESTTMIPLLPEDIHFDFSTAVTGTILFPFYSIALVRYVLPGRPRWSRIAGAASSILVFGAAVFTACYDLLPVNW